jgi:glycosyltransferase involved in cell wall biosynthesis
MKLALVEDAGGDAEKVRALVRRHSGVTGVLLHRNVGQQRATYLGILRLLDCDAIVTMDQDGAHPVDLLADMLARIAGGADLCYAVPSRAGLSPFRRAGAALRDLFFSLSTNKPRGVRVGAYRAMTVALARRIEPEPDGYIYLSAAAFRHNPRAVSIRCDAVPEKSSSYTPWKRIRLYGGLLFHYTPLRVFWRGGKRKPPCPMTVLPGKGFL